jgi:hypothetical protein
MRAGGSDAVHQDRVRVAAGKILLLALNHVRTFKARAGAPQDGRGGGKSAAEVWQHPVRERLGRTGTVYASWARAGTLDPRSANLPHSLAPPGAGIL